MKKFRFRLERVMQYRQVVRRERQRELMLLNAKLTGEEQKLAQLRQSELDIAVPQGSIMGMEEFLMGGLYAARLKKEIIDQRVLIAETEKQVEEARNKYIEAAKDAKALEMLREKKQKDYLEYVEKEDGKALDEMVTQRISRLRQRQEAI